MELENLLIGTGTAFGAGFLQGMYIDRRHVARFEIASFQKEIEGKKEEAKHALNIASKIQNSSSNPISLFVGALASYTHKDIQSMPPSYIIYGLSYGLAFKGGTMLGSYVGKKIRASAKPTEQEQADFNKYLHQLTDAANKGEMSKENMNSAMTSAGQVIDDVLHRTKSTYAVRNMHLQFILTATAVPYVNAVNRSANAARSATEN